MKEWALNENLLDAVSNSHAERVRELLELGASLTYSDESGNTPLHKCAIVASQDMDSTSFIQITKTLIMHGSEPNLENNDGKTVYELCPTEPWKQLIDGFVLDRNRLNKAVAISTNEVGLASTALDQSSTSITRVRGVDKVAVPKEPVKVVFLSQ